MPIGIESFHDDIRSVLKKYNSSFVSPEDIDFAINKSCLDILLEIIEKHENTSERYMVDQELLVLHEFSGDAIVRTLPSDVFKASSVFTGNYEGDILPDTEFNDRLNSVIMPPIATRPIATIYKTSGGNNTIEIVPSSDSHKLKYWKVPTKCNYAYTEANGVVSYTATGSVDIDFPQSQYTKLFNRTLTYLAPSAKDPDAAVLEQNILR